MGAVVFCPNVAIHYEHKEDDEVKGVPNGEYCGGWYF